MQGMSEQRWVRTLMVLNRELPECPVYFPLSGAMEDYANVKNRRLGFVFRADLVKSEDVGNFRTFEWKENDLPPV